MTKEVIEGLGKLHGDMLKIAEAEIGLVRTFSDDLSTLNGNLVTALRQVSARYNAERGDIAAELNYLATETLGLPAPAAAPIAVAPMESPPAMPTAAPGDWRQATQAMAGDLDDLLADELPPTNGHAAPVPFQ